MHDEANLTAEVARLGRLIDRLQHSALNPLHAFVLPAQILAPWFRRHADRDAPEEVAASEGWGPALHRSDGSYRDDPARTIELAGVLGLYEHLAARSAGCEVLFVNDLAQIVHGIDGIGWDPSRARYRLLESKGTTRPLRGSWRSYLRRTKHKGRQLGWQWCWSSWMELSGSPHTAAVFLRLTRALLEERVDRELVVSHVRKVAGGYLPDGVRRCWGETTLCEARPDWTERRAWFAEIEAAGLWYEPHDHAVVDVDDVLGHHDLRGTNLIGLDLDGKDLSGVELRGALLHGASLRRATLRGAALEEACLFGTDLRGADLRDCTGASPKQFPWSLRDEDTRWPKGLRPASFAEPAASIVELVLPRPLRRVLDKREGVEPSGEAP